MQYAGVGRRAVAVIIDLIIISALGSPIWLTGVVFQAPTMRPGTTEIVTPGAIYANPWTGLLLAILPLAYFALLEGFFGATPGKMLLGMRVVKLDGAPIGWREAIVRNLLRYIDEIVLYLVGAISMWNSPRRQRLGDRAADCVVIHIPPAREVMPAGGVTSAAAPMDAADREAGALPQHN